MAVPARGSAADQDPAAPAAGRPGPPSGWADVQRALITEARACALSVAEIARRPGDKAAVKVAASMLAALEAVTGLARGQAAAEVADGLDWQRGFDEGYAACKAARGRLGVITGGAAGPA